MHIYMPPSGTIVHTDIILCKAGIWGVQYIPNMTIPIKEENEVIPITICIWQMEFLNKTEDFGVIIYLILAYSFQLLLQSFTFVEKEIIKKN